MKIDVSDESELCGCETCVQHRTLSNTQETEPSNVAVSSVSLVPVSCGAVQAQGSSPIRFGTATPLAPPVVTTPVNPEPDSTIGVINSKDAPAHSSTATSSPLQTCSPSIFSFPPTVSSQPPQALAPTTSGSLPPPVFTSYPLPASGPSLFSSTPAPLTNFFGYGASPASSPSIFGPIQATPFGSVLTATSTSPTSSPLRWESVQAPVQANAPNTSTPFSFVPAQGSAPPFSYPGGFARPDVRVSPTAPSGFFGQNHFSSQFGRTQDFAKTGGVCASSTTHKNPFGSLHSGFGVNCLPPPSLFGQNPPITTPASGRGSFWAGAGTEQGSRYPRYAPTPDLDTSGGQGKMIISISASNSHRHKSHEELRWEDYKKGDKGGFGWFPPAHTPSLFTPPSIPDHPQRTTIGPTHRNMTGFPTAVQRPHEPAGVSSPASGCTTCGATSSSSPSGHLGFHGTTTTSAVQPNHMMFGTPNLAAQGTTTLAAQPYPMMFGTLNIVAQGTTTPAVQPYAMMFGTPNLGAQGITPAAQAYPIHGLILLPFAAMNLQ